MDLSNYKLIQQEASRLKMLSPDDREDLVQDVYLRLLEMAVRGKHPASINKAYIKKLVRNTLVDKQRKDASRPQVIYNSELANKLIDKGE